MPEQPDVRKDQEWIDADPRSQGRRIKVLRFDEDVVCDGDGIARITYRVPVAVVRRVLPNGDLVGRETRIRLDRFRPTSTGYRLIAYGCHPGDCSPADGAIPQDAIGTESTGWRWACEHGRPHTLVDGYWIWRVTDEESLAMKGAMAR